MTHVREVPKRFFIRPRNASILASVLGACVGVAVLQFRVYVSELIITVPPIVLAVLLTGHRIRRGRTILLCVVCYHLSGAALLVAIDVLRGLTHFLYSPWFGVIVSLPFSLLGSTVCWGILGACRGIPIPKPDLCCFGCDYDLRGNQSGVCPECGRSIDYQELGVTSEDLKHSS